MKAERMREIAHVLDRLEEGTPWEWAYEPSEGVGPGRYVADVPAHYELEVEIALGVVVYISAYKYSYQTLDEAIRGMRAAMIHELKPTIERMQDELDELRELQEGDNE